MLEKDVHRLPQGVIEDLDDLLMNEWILRCVGAVVIAFRAGKCHGHRSAAGGVIEGCGNFGIAFRRAETHYDIVWVKNGVEPGSKTDREIEGRQRALADDYRMHELDRHMLSIRGIRATPECQQAATAQETLRHGTGGFGELGRF